jgi:hypothetical protein
MTRVIRHSRHAVAIVLLCVVTMIVGASLPTSLQFASSPARAVSPEGTLEILAQPFSFRTSQYGIFRILVPESVANDNNASIEVRIHRRVTSREQIQDIVDRGNIPRVTDVAIVSIPNIPTDDNGALLVRVPLQAFNQGLSGLYMAEPGVYPTTVVARQAGQITAQALTFLHRVSPTDTAGAVPTSFVIAVRATPSIQPNGSIVVGDDVRERIKRFVDTITTINAPFTIAIQPEIVSSLANSSSGEDAAIFERLQQALAGRTLALLPFVPIDVSAASRANATDEYLRQLRLGEDVLLQLLPDTTVQRSTAIITDPLDVSGVSLLRDAGRRTIIATPSAIENFRFSASSSVKSALNRNDIAPITLLLSDQSLHNVMKSPVSKPVERAHRIVAELLLHRRDLVDNGVNTSDMRFVLSSFDGALPSQQLLQSLLSLLRTETSFSLINSSLDSPATASTPEVTVPQVGSGDISERTAALSALQVERDATASMLPAGDPRIVFWEQLDGLIISSVVSDYVPYLDGLRSQFASLRDAVTLANPGAVTLGSRNGDIRFQMRNTAPENLTVRIVVSSPKLEFPADAKVVTLTANSTTDVVIPVRTRTNGRFPVLVQITTPEGNFAVIEPVTFSARVTAVAGLGQLVTVSFLLIVLAWWWASWRKSRREREQGGTVLHA